MAHLRKRIEIALLPDDVRVALHLDGLAERERHRRRAQAQLILRSLTNGLPSRTNVCTRPKRTCGPQGGSPGLTQSGGSPGRHLRTAASADSILSNAICCPALVGAADAIQSI